MSAPLMRSKRRALVPSSSQQTRQIIAAIESEEKIRDVSDTGKKNTRSLIHFWPKCNCRVSWRMLLSVDRAVLKPRTSRLPHAQISRIICRWMQGRKEWIGITMLSVLEMASRRMKQFFMLIEIRLYFRFRIRDIHPGLLPQTQQLNHRKV